MNTATLTIIAWLMLAQAPVSVAAAIFLWQLHSKSRRLDTRNPKPILRLSLVMFVTGAIAAAAALELGIASIFYLLGLIEITQRLGLPTFLAFVVLDYIPVINALYLRWLARDRRGGGGESPSEPADGGLGLPGPDGHEQEG